MSRVARILLVEDNFANRDMLSRRLVRSGFTVLIAEDGEQAIAVALRELPDVILMDISLPYIDGLEATRQIKAHASTCRTPVIALTAHALTDDRDKATAAGCDDFATKPVDFPRLLATVNAWLERATPP